MNSLNVLRASTAIVVALSFVGSHAVAGQTSVDFQLAQTTEAVTEQPVDATATTGAETAVEAEATTEAAAPAAEVEAEVEAAAEGAAAATTDAATDAAAATTDAATDAAAATTDAAAPAATDEQPAAAEAPATDEQPAAEAEAPQADTAASDAAPADAAASEASETTESEGTTAVSVDEPAAADAEQDTGDAATATTDETPAETGSDAAASAPAADEAPATEATGTTDAATAVEPTAAPATAATEEATETDAAATDAGATETAPATAETAADADAEADAAAETTAGTEQPAATGDTDAAAVTEAEIEQATSTGADVVIEDTTTSEDLEQALESLREQTVDVEQLDNAQAVNVEEEVVTEETARSSSEEAAIVAPAADDDDNNTWKYLGAAAAGAAVGALVPALGGRLVQDQGDRVIVERDGEFYVRKDENQLLRQPGVRMQTESFENGVTRSTAFREDGSRIVTLRDQGGFILRRTRITPQGEEIVLIDDTQQQSYTFRNWDNELPAISSDIPQDQYIVNYSGVDREVLRDTLSAKPMREFDQTFSLRDVRENQRVRDLVPRIDLDAINFESGSAAIQRSEVEDLTSLGRAMAAIIEENPREVFLVEGHTDATGSNLMNLALSDRRAESVALALTEYFDIPPENLVVQGYGERYLKEQTQGPSAVNRRATVRRITPLIDRVASR